jgi:hypothetical protein
MDIPRKAILNNFNMKTLKTAFLRTYAQALSDKKEDPLTHL